MLCGVQDGIDLEAFLSNVDRPQQGLYKCRMVYDDQTRAVEFLPYTPKQISSLRIVEHDRISYEFKYRDRSTLDRLYALRRQCDDVLIVRKGLVTDTSYANIVFRRGDRWFTPWSALLKGTMRANLLEQNRVEEEEIRVEEIGTFQTFKLINALLEFDSPEIDVSNIVS
jgi:4-amino-4-deoxychorismate lyase